MYGLDLLDFFRGHYSWRKLLLLLDKMPTASHYVEALTQDVEVAEASPEADDASSAPRAPAWSTWTLEAELLASIVDRLGDLAGITLSTAGGKAPLTRPTRRPVTAHDRAREQARRRKHEDLVAEVALSHARYEAMHELNGR